MNVLIQISGFCTGIISFILIAVTYFNSVNKDIVKMFGVKTSDNKEDSFQPIRKTPAKNTAPKKSERDWHIETYLSSFTSISLARGYKHYKREMLIKVFKQNHSMGALFAVIVIISLLGLSFGREIPVFEIPAGASLMLLFTFYVMLASAFHTWVRGWSGTVFILIILIVNFIYKFDFFYSENRAYGMNYKNEKAEFSYRKLFEDDSRKDLKENDIDSTIEILNKWRLKNSTHSIINKKKPKLVIINTSGGGLRSTLWSFYSLQYADSVLQGELLKHTQLISGSSGGIIGASYLRELYLEYQEKKIKNYYDKTYTSNVSLDILNPIAFSIATNDLFFRVQKVKDGKNTYTKDRGYSFENTLNENTGFVLNKRLCDYQQPEANALIPMLIMAPTIINDGRKLLISSQHISYLTQNSIRGTVSIHPLVESIEFRRFFEKQDADNLKYTTALRMNSSFPYIAPIISLPSNPAIEVIDAGMRDNYGLDTTFKFLYTFRNWITTNTSGVIILQIRDRHKEFAIEENASKTVSGILGRPLGSFYGNLFNVQDFSQQQLVQYASLWFEGKIDFVDLEMNNDNRNHISLSWHLTNKEKKNIKESINSDENQEAIRRLDKLLN